jgi:hypothetical protein
VASTAGRSKTPRHHRGVTKKKITPEAAQAIGAAVLLARPLQTPWKLLIERFGLCRARLVQLRIEAMRRGGGG